MKRQKIKTFVITVAKTFPTKHKRFGEPTNFRQLIESGEKIHTMRLNYPYWKHIVAQVNSGAAIISLRQWTGKPYSSKQEEFKVLTYKDGISIVGFRMDVRFNNVTIFDSGYRQGNIYELAKNDGLSVDDFKEWFKDVRSDEMGAIIHFNSFRYL